MENRTNDVARERAKMFLQKIEELRAEREFEFSFRQNPYEDSDAGLKARFDDEMYYFRLLNQSEQAQLEAEGADRPERLLELQIRDVDRKLEFLQEIVMIRGSEASRRQYLEIQSELQEKRNQLELLLAKQMGEIV